MRIRELINEGLPLGISKRYRREWNPQMYADLFRQFPDRDRNAFRIYLPITDTRKADAPDRIKDALKAKGYAVTDYAAGLAKEINGKRVMRIGRLLADDPTLLKLYVNDSARAGSRAKDRLVCISRHPHDVASMSTGRGWTSCLDQGCSPCGHFRWRFSTTCRSSDTNKLASHSLYPRPGTTDDRTRQTADREG